jgi:hypothetical protein
MQLQRIATETHLAQKLGEKLGLAIAEHSQNTLIKQVHKSTTQNGFKTIFDQFGNTHARVNRILNARVIDRFARFADDNVNSSVAQLSKSILQVTNVKLVSSARLVPSLMG